MLSNTITLSVDEQNNSSLVDVDFQRFDAFQNRSLYISEDHEPGMRDTLTFYRTLPKQSGNFKGVRKTSFKFSEDVVVATTDMTDTISSHICEVSFSIPIGVTPAQQMKIRQRAIALLDSDSIMTQLNDLQVV